MGSTRSPVYAARSEQLRQKGIALRSVEAGERSEGRSKLTADPLGLMLWTDLCAFLNVATTKSWRHKEPTMAAYQITKTHFVLPEGDVEALVHDLCHWVVATEDQRNTDNLGMSSESPQRWMIRQEELAWALESWVQWREANPARCDSVQPRPVT